MPREDDGELEIEMPYHPNWKVLSTVAYPYKRFVHESKGSDVISITTVSPSVVSEDNSKATYEDILALPLENTGKQDYATVVNIERSDSKNLENKVHRNLSKCQWVNALMTEASQNNIQGIKNLFGVDKDINITDQYGWTMLMCAAHAGATAVVKYLLEEGADVQVKDKSGYSCVSLAKRQKHFEILNLLKNHVCQSQSEEKKSANKLEINKGFCDVCKLHYEESPTSLHRNSTVHLFNIHPRKDTTWYGIPDNNKGFKLMLKNGWKREQGLGPEGSGTKVPPKTILKRDRKGFGIKSGEPRVTHFKPHDARAIGVNSQNESRSKRKHKISIKSRVSSERRKEHHLRLELNF